MPTAEAPEEAPSAEESAVRRRPYGRRARAIPPPLDAAAWQARARTYQNVLFNIQYNAALYAWHIAASVLASRGLPMRLIYNFIFSLFVF